MAREGDCEPSGVGRRRAGTQGRTLTRPGGREGGDRARVQRAVRGDAGGDGELDGRDERPARDGGDVLRGEWGGGFGDG